MTLDKHLVATLAVAVACALVPAGSASASPVVLAGSNDWNAWTTSQLQGGPFWAHGSYDRNGLANIGYFISNTAGSNIPGFYNASPGATLPYLGGGSTTFALDLTTPWQPTDFSHLLSVTGWNDEFGLFNVATNEKYELFRAWDTEGLKKAFNPTGIFGFYLTNGDGQTWYSTTLDNGRNHFALFQGTSQWYLGVEDATFTTRLAADWDYNDVIVGWAEPVPDPGSTLLLLASGLASLAGALKLRRA